ncbi:MAG: 2-dehydro-3-deoxygalactonokinase [Oricola sp.]
MSANAAVDEVDWIAADWGTTSVRVWAISADGRIVGRASSQDGMGRLAREDYEPALFGLLEGMLAPARSAPVPVIVCGMAGARQGWREAAYRQVPCGPVAAGEMTPVETRDSRVAVRIVPGLCQRDPADVMRGEETQLAGLVRLRGDGDATVCMPGTHSKWVRLEGGSVISFMTFMTGELFAVAASQSVLRMSVADDGSDEKSFLDAVAETLEHPERLTSALFSIRSASLLGDLSPVQARSRLSGLLIGAELAATRPHWQSDAVRLVGAEEIAKAYEAALNFAGATVMREDAEELTLAGLALARSLMSEGAP